MTIKYSAPDILGQVDPGKPISGLEHLAHILPRDIVILSTPHDDNTDDLSWQELTDIITTNNLAALKRRPAGLRNYLRWKDWIEKTRLRGGVLEFIVVEKLHWEDPDDDGSGMVKLSTPVNPRFMACVKDDLKILMNDFPYAMQPGIVHIVVWTRAKIPLDSETGDLTQTSRDLINKYVDATFVKNKALRLDSKDHALWFKNWAALQSIPALEHFHVLLKNPDMKELEKLCNTGGVQINLDV